MRDGIALEGTATSFFAVFGNTVVTAPKSNYILPSITRQVTIDIAERIGIAVDERPIPFDTLETADELFLAGTTMEVMTIIRVDGNPVRTETVGPITRKLQEQFRTVVARGT